MKAFKKVLAFVGALYLNCDFFSEVDEQMTKFEVPSKFLSQSCKCKQCAS